MKKSLYCTSKAKQAQDVGGENLMINANMLNDFPHQPSETAQFPSKAVTILSP
jgi:hypothetical protein